jgi:Uma2 family endonuclease
MKLCAVGEYGASSARRWTSCELEGSPEMVLEVVSETSVHKDTEELRELYWHAGTLEYWLVDARTDATHFDILHYGRKGYTTTRKHRRSALSLECASLSRNGKARLV